jgi:phage tail-like protein
MSKPTRREFLKSTVLGAVGTGLTLTAPFPEYLLADPQAGNRGYTAGRYALEIDGIMAGWLHSAEGGHATSDVVNEKIGPDRLQRKNTGNVKYEDITLTCGTGMSKGFYEWLKATLDRQYQRKNGAIVSCDYNYKELSRREFHNALITEIGFPALDAASKDAAKMTIKFRPEFTRTQTTTGGAAKAALPANVQKKWLPSNFRLQIPGLDCTKVNKVEAITVKQKVVENPIGQVRDYQKEPANVESPNLIITLPEANAAGFLNWQKDFVISGKSNKAAEKTGQLTYLTEDLRETLFTLNFHGLGIFKLTHDKVEAHNEQMARVKAEMYCESIQFSYGPAAWA